MPNTRLADRYAKSILDLAIEKGELEAVCADMKYLQAVCKVSADFVNLLKSPIVKAEQKNKIINAITDSKVSALTQAFTALMVKKGREASLPEITNAFIAQYNTLKGIHLVTLTTAVEISEALKQSIEQKVKAENNFTTVELTTKVDEKLIGGFVLEFNNNLLDASIARDLKDIKKQFLSNEFVGKI